MSENQVSTNGYVAATTDILVKSYTNEIVNELRFMSSVSQPRGQLPHPDQIYRIVAPIIRQAIQSWRG